jgi:hypothetical protein
MVFQRTHPEVPTSQTARSPANKLKIVVLGYIVRGPVGGMAWHHLQYVLGLKNLGHDVLFLEYADDWPSCYDPMTNQVGTDPSYGLQFATSAFAKVNLGSVWAYYDTYREYWYGPASERVDSFCNEADVILNVSGVNPIRSSLERIPLRVLIDTDPVFTQIRHLTIESARNRALQHNAYFSFGEAIESREGAVPNDQFAWHATRQPIVLDAWPLTTPPKNGAFTTVMQWESYPPIEFDGRRFGLKSYSFQAIRDLPSRVKTSLEIALGGIWEMKAKLEPLGWRLVDPLRVTRDPWTYQDYIQRSRGEFSVAKHGYVVGRSGWFSERTACYLATGRPAIVQDTGFSRHIPCGEGLWAFDDVEMAASALDQVERDYQRQCRAAREIAAEYFDSSKVLNSLLERAFSTSDAQTGKEP